MKSHLHHGRNYMIRNICDPLVYIQEEKPSSRDYIAIQNGEGEVTQARYSTVGIVSNFSKRQRQNDGIPNEAVKITIPSDCLHVCPCVGDCVISNYCTMSCIKGRELRVTEVNHNHIHGLYELQAVPS